jgi:hypothetical protein
MSYDPSLSGSGRQHDVARRLEEFFRVADLRCSRCGDWHGDPSEFGISSKAEWEERMVRELLWIRSNATAVRDALPLLEEEWSQCCDVVRNLLQLPG